MTSLTLQAAVRFLSSTFQQLLEPSASASFFWPCSALYSISRLPCCERRSPAPAGRTSPPRRSCSSSSSSFASRSRCSKSSASVGTRSFKHRDLLVLVVRLGVDARPADQPFRLERLGLAAQFEHLRRLGELTGIVVHFPQRLQDQRVRHSSLSSLPPSSAALPRRRRPGVPAGPGHRTPSAASLPCPALASPASRLDAVACPGSPPPAPPSGRVVRVFFVGRLQLGQRPLLLGRLAALERLDHLFRDSPGSPSRTPPCPLCRPSRSRRRCPGRRRRRRAVRRCVCWPYFVFRYST